MYSRVYNFNLSLSFKVLRELSSIDRFDASWSALEKKEAKQTLRQLKAIATVQSVGSSTRIEGSQLTNDEVKVLISEAVKIARLEERDEQEVLGYYKAMELISESWQDIPVNESNLKNLHGILLKYSDKDQWHRGDYKKHSNTVEARNPDGSSTVIFRTTAPGIETEDAMSSLINWYHSDEETPAVIKIALFIYEFLSIHPFQDGNGRMSRLLGSLLLLKHGYSWIEYVSFENEIENRKSEYYQVLMHCQSQRPDEDLSPWLLFFLDCMVSIQSKLKAKLEKQDAEGRMSVRERMIYSYIDMHPGAKSGEIAKSLQLPLPTVKRLLTGMLEAQYISKDGSGVGTNYSSGNISRIKSNLFLEFTEGQRQHKLSLRSRHSFIEITKIEAVPRFKWELADDWAIRYSSSNLILKISCEYPDGSGTHYQPYYLPAFNSPMHRRPFFEIKHPIHIPDISAQSSEPVNKFPVQVTISIEGDLSEFDIKLIYNSGF